jgi:putative pyoverdin transport system ATP-binding/permease protein
MNLARLLLSSAKGTVFLAVAAGFIGGACSVGLIALIQFTLAQEGNTAWLAWSFAGLCLTVLLARVISQALLIRLSQGAVFRLYSRLSREILSVPLRQFEQLGNHRLLAALTEDVPAIASALLGLPILCVNIAILLCCFLYLGWLSPLLLGGVLGFLALGVLSYQLPVWMALRHLHSARQEQDTLMKHFRSLTDGVKELQMHESRREEFLEQLLGRTAARLRDRNTAGMTLYALAGTWGQLLFFICIGLLLFGLHSWDHFARAVVSGYVLTILYTIAPLETIMAWLPVMGRARVALRSVEDLSLSLKNRMDENTSRPNSASKEVIFEELELVGVTYAYHGTKEDGFMLGPLDLTLHRGELVFVIGGNGSGKTTLAKLIVGLYAPATGEIRLNGQVVPEEGRAKYRQMFSVVFADVHLFEQLLGMESAELDARARDYLKQLELGHKVQVQGGTFSTTELSQGQRKRLALLTAYLEDRQVYVFDEWAADQDPRFKEVFYTRLLPELKARGKAVLVISHDERYFHVADRVVKFDYGTLAEMRPAHDTLYEQQSLASDPATSAPG